MIYQLSSWVSEISVANTTIEEKSHSFASGDNIEVSEGELLNLRGKVISVDGDKIVMMPDHEDLKVYIHMPILVVFWIT